MEGLVYIGIAAVVVLISLVYGFIERGGDETQASKRAHENAQERDPPVELGETYKFGITEFTDHHSGDRVAVGKVEGFVLFTDDVPSSVSKGDVIRAKVTSFNRGHTSADAVFVGSR